MGWLVVTVGRLVGWWSVCLQRPAAVRVRRARARGYTRQPGRGQPAAAWSSRAGTDLHQAAVLASHTLLQVRLHGRRHAGTTRVTRPRTLSWLLLLLLFFLPHAVKIPGVKN